MFFAKSPRGHDVLKSERIVFFVFCFCDDEDDSKNERVVFFRIYSESKREGTARLQAIWSGSGTESCWSYPNMFSLFVVHLLTMTKTEHIRKHNQMILKPIGFKRHFQNERFITSGCHT